jgi:hypothetical protein
MTDIQHTSNVKHRVVGGLALAVVTIAVMAGTSCRAQRASGPWSVTVGVPEVVPNAAGVPIYRWFPDGHITVMPDGAGKWMMFWAEFDSYRTLGNTPYPENHTILSPQTKVFGGRGGTSWDNGGSWLMAVFRVSGEELVAFYHAEDHWAAPNPDGIAWKSIAVTYSADNGVTWTPGEQIITGWQAKPETPQWGGAGDQGVVWDAESERWVCFYQEQAESGGAKLHVAVSSDPLGSRGTWYKWDGKDFTVPGLGGKGAPLPSFKNRQGANPSLHWNTYLEQWIMVYGGWDGVTYIASSQDLIHWTPSQALVRSDQGGRAWYPTIIGEDGDAVAGQSARLYYADISADFVSRKFYGSTLTFSRP